MDFVQATSSGQTAVATQSAAATAPSATSATAQSGSSTGSSAIDFNGTTKTIISGQVQTMLGAIAPALVDNELLKMAITLMILDILLGNDSEQSGAGALMMGALAGGGSQSSTFMSSETMTIVIEYSGSSYETASSPSDSAQTTGGNVDTVA